MRKKSITDAKKQEELEDDIQKMEKVGIYRIITYVKFVHIFLVDL